MKKIALVFCVLAGSVLLGCGKKEESAPQAAMPSPAATVQAANALPIADPSVSLDSYQRLTTEHLVYLRHALSSEPVNYEQIAWQVSPEFRSSTDAFKKKDLLEALKPQVDAKLADAKKSWRYLYVDFKPGDVFLGHYDLDKKSFPIYGIGSSNIFLTNGDAYKHLPMPDESRAREVEAAIAKGVAYEINPNEQMLPVPGRFPTTSRLYVFAQEAGPDGGPLRFQIVKLVMKTTDGQALAEK